MGLSRIRNYFFNITAIVLVLCVFIPLINGQCSSHHFRCRTNKCIPIAWQCDDENDCGDGSDELNCEARTCSDTEFVCNNGKCIPNRWQCDNEK
uniref:U2-Sparatoxin-Hju1a_1 n=1 Tax=Heteropoda jugulans TaxID=1358901 RepID=A0A4V2H9W6_9ARAC